MSWRRNRITGRARSGSSSPGLHTRPRAPADMIRRRAFHERETMFIAGDKKRLDKDFTYHPPKGDQPARYQEIRAKARSLAVIICKLCPESRERSIALTKLEEASMWANASIARNEE